MSYWIKARGFALRSLSIGSLLSLVLGFFPTGVSSAEEAPASDRFLPTLDYVLTIGDRSDPAAEFYLSERGDAYLIFSEEFPSPVVLRLADRGVLEVPEGGLSRSEDGLIDLLPSAERRSLGEFGVDGNTPTFELDGETVKIAYPEPLLGDQELAALQDYNPEYERRTAGYRPDPALMRELAEAVGEEPLRVKIYFGTWCSICSRAMPHLMKVLDSLGEGAEVEVEYYGLPQERGADPEVEKAGLQGLPTAIVYRGEEEIGRLERDQFRRPEESLGALLVPTPGSD